MLLISDYIISLIFPLSNFLAHYSYPANTFLVPSWIVRASNMYPLSHLSPWSIREKCPFPVIYNILGLRPFGIYVPPPAGCGPWSPGLSPSKLSSLFINGLKEQDSDFHYFKTPPCNPEPPDYIPLFFNNVNFLVQDEPLFINNEHFVYMYNLSVYILSVFYI